MDTVEVYALPALPTGQRRGRHRGRDTLRMLEPFEIPGMAAATCGERLGDFLQMNPGGIDRGGGHEPRSARNDSSNKRFGSFG
jgi:hypothetical protein